MSDNRERVGLLGKVTQLVRSGKERQDDAFTRGPEAGGYDKKQLKAIIERKRRNDQIRKKEFDYLRKLRNHEVNTTNSHQPVASSFFSSQHSEIEGKAHTLKKIDEIEAQMSKQWWKGRTEAESRNGAGETTLPPDSTAAAADTVPPVSAGQTATSHQPTVPVSLDGYDTTQRLSLRQPLGANSSHGARLDFEPTMPAQHMPGPTARGGIRASDMPTQPPMGLDFSSTDLLSYRSQQLVHDPELEEAAIRFANGDNFGAAAVLRDALEKRERATEIVVNMRASALLDVYRIVGDQPAFDATVQRYSALWGQELPVWRGTQMLDFAQEIPDATFALPGATWVSPVRLTLAAAHEMALKVHGAPTPYLLDWRALQQVDPEALSELTRFFRHLADSMLPVQFAGEWVLLNALQALTPMSDKAVPIAFWETRFEAMRVMQKEEDFELVALDYCMTYEISPPSWEPSGCAYRSIDAPALSTPKPLTEQVPVPVLYNSELALRGNVTGDAGGILDAMLERVGRDMPVLVVDCHALERIDFTSAGNLLNWVIKMQAEGKQVQFVDLNRLVAAFFKVIGFHEYAKLQLSPL